MFVDITKSVQKILGQTVEEGQLNFKMIAVVQEMEEKYWSQMKNGYADFISKNEIK